MSFFRDDSSSLLPSLLLLASFFFHFGQPKAQHCVPRCLPDIFSVLLPIHNCSFGAYQYGRRKFSRASKTIGRKQWDALSSHILRSVIKSCRRCNKGYKGIFGILNSLHDEFFVIDRTTAIASLIMTRFGCIVGRGFSLMGSFILAPSFCTTNFSMPCVTLLFLFTVNKQITMIVKMASQYLLMINLVINLRSCLRYTPLSFIFIDVHFNVHSNDFSFVHFSPWSFSLF